MESRDGIFGHNTIADKIASWCISALVFLIPIFFIPSQNVPFQFTKVMLMYGLVIASFIAWIIGRLKDGKITLSRHGVFLSLGAIIVTYLLASVFSPARTISFIGQGFEISTFGFITAMALFVFLISNLFTDKKRMAYVYLAFIASFVVIVLFQLIRLFGGPSVLSFNVFSLSTDNLIGSWNDLGLYFGATALFSFITLELMRMPKWMRIICRVMLGISLFFLSVINFRYVWFVLGAFALIFFIYNFSFKRAHQQEASPIQTEEGKRIVPIVSFVVLIISFVFILIQGNIYSAITPLNRLAITNIEVSPSWTSTWQVAKASIIKHPILGVGPNRFLSEWMTSKPAEVNNTIFWSTNFNYGIGLIPTLLVTTGVLGFLAWLAFMAYFLYMGFKALFTRVHQSFISYISISSFIIALYFWIFAIFHVPSAALMVLTFMFTGVFFASSIDVSLIPVKTFDIVKDPRRSFVSVLVLIAILLGVVVFGYDISLRYVASIYYNRGLAAANTTGALDVAEENINRALSYSQDDQYYRTLTQINLLKINQLLQQQNLTQDTLKSKFPVYLQAAKEAASSALAIDKTKYENWISLGNVSESVVQYNFDGAYDQAVAAYNEAKRLSPLNPSIPLILARLEVEHKNVPQAKAYIADALKLKNNYSDAIFMLAQIQIGEGDLKSAIQSVEALTYTQPNDSGVYFQLGLLRYNNKDFEGAASAFEQAVNITPDYANAHYFLGLAYNKLKRQNDALAQFQEILKTNPGNQDIETIIKNIQAGKDPLAGTSQTDVAGKGTTAPLQEQSDTQKPDTADR